MARLHVFALLTALALLGVLLSGCTQQVAPSEKEIKIGVVASMTGPASTTGKDMWQSAVIAQDEINAKGGVYVKDLNTYARIRLIQGDDESTREGGIKAVTKLITDDKVDLLVGGFSSAVTSAHEAIVAENQVPYIITGASSPVITRNPDVNISYIFHHCPTTDDYGEQTVLFVDQVLRPAINTRFNFSEDRPIRIAIVYQDSLYGKGVQSAINATIQKYNLKMVIVSEQAFKMGETDFRTILTSVKASKPDVVYPAAFLNEQIPLVTQGQRDVGLDTIFLSVECNDDPDYYKGVGNYGEYSIQESRFSPYTMPVSDVATAAGAFKNSFKEKWGGFPGMMGASTYEGVYIAVAAIKESGTLEKSAVKDAIGQVKIPEIIEPMQGGVITFSQKYHESKFALYMEQLRLDTVSGEPRPVIVWPDNLKESGFILPDWYRPGGM
ncbi:MAG: ABC transporter substrate-binding protein [Methanomicrobiales archaeon]|nr:ABC transporter substrate-binding protein [Methanomicrobiales archaeon]